MFVSCVYMLCCPVFAEAFSTSWSLIQRSPIPCLIRSRNPKPCTGYPVTQYVSCLSSTDINICWCSEIHTENAHFRAKVCSTCVMYDILLDLTIIVIIETRCSKTIHHRLSTELQQETTLCKCDWIKYKIYWTEFLHFIILCETYSMSRKSSDIGKLVTRQNM
jgi:hypothetical protein